MNHLILVLISCIPKFVGLSSRLNTFESNTFEYVWYLYFLFLFLFLLLLLFLFFDGFIGYIGLILLFDHYFVAK